MLCAALDGSLLDVTCIFAFAKTSGVEYTGSTYNEELEEVRAALRAQKPSEPVGGRAETGPVRFGDDWAGVFIRGDEAFSRALQMDAVAEHYEGLADGDFSGKGMLAINIQGFADLLRSCTELCEARAIHLAAEEDE